MLKAGIVIGLLVFVSRLLVYFVFIRRWFPGFCNWTEQSTKRMFFWEMVNVLTLQIAGSITGIIGAATATILGVMTSIIIVNVKKAMTWQRY